MIPRGGECRIVGVFGADIADACEVRDQAPIHNGARPSRPPRACHRSVRSPRRLAFRRMRVQRPGFRIDGRDPTGARARSPGTERLFPVPGGECRAGLESYAQRLVRAEAPLQVKAGIAHALHVSDTLRRIGVEPGVGQRGDDVQVVAHAAGQRRARALDRAARAGVFVTVMRIRELEREVAGPCVPVSSVSKRCAASARPRRSAVPRATAACRPHAWRIGRHGEPGPEEACPRRGGRGRGANRANRAAARGETQAPWPARAPGRCARSAHPAGCGPCRSVHRAGRFPP